MGNICAEPSYGGEVHDKAQGKAVDQHLNFLNKEEEKVIKILLLGAGECGKSTILKQMKILHEGGFTEAERKEKIFLVRSNTVESICAIIKAARNFNIELEDAKAEEFSEEIIKFSRSTMEDKEETREMGEKMAYVFENSSIQTIFCERSSEFRLLDSAPYFLNQIKTIFAPDYMPCEQDIIRTRLATVGIIESNFHVDKRIFKFYDVGGQRGERKKWIHCFESVRAILFIASLSEYDQVLEEDMTKNRMEESLNLFNSIVNLSWFAETPIILFLNKEDIFMKKIEKIDMGIYFQEYTGGCDLDLGVLFIKEQFFKQNQNPNNTIYVHRTNATDTKHFAAIWTFTRHIVLQKNLSRAGLVI